MRWLLIAIFLSALTACDKYSSFDFEEELPLHDGRTLLVKHHIELGAKGRRIGESSSPLWESFTFENPDRPGEIVTFKSPHTDYGPKTTLMLDVYQGVPYAVVGTAYGYKRPEGNPKLKPGCPLEGMECYECPNPPYLLFRWRAGQWEQLRDFTEFPKHFHKINADYDYDAYLGRVDGGYPAVWVKGARIERAYVDRKLEQRASSGSGYIPPFKEIQRLLGDEIRLLCPGNKNPPLTPSEIADGVKYSG